MSDSAVPISVEVVYALAQQQWLVNLQLPAGSTVAEAIARSGLHEHVPGLHVDDAHVGVFSQPATLSHVLRDGDRVEIYRPLQVDPMQARRARADVQRGGRRR